MRVYNDLKKRGVNAFFSFITLENEVDSDDLIWVNLVKSKKMLLIGSERDYLESAWVKSEWKRWLFLERDEDMHICVMKHDHEMPKSVLPRELYAKGPQIYTLDTYDKMIESLCASSDNDTVTQAASREQTVSKDDIRAWFENGQKYYHGNGVAQNYAEAVKWYEKAAEHGKVEAQNSLAFCYYYGQGVEVNYEKAAKWWQKGAENGYSIAQSNFAFCYESGKGIKQDYAKAVEWYEKAAAQNHAGAQNNLGSCYKDGRGVEQNYKKAIECYTKSAENGDVGAQNNLALCYYYGQGVEVSYEKAAEWWQKAAENGYSIAQSNLAFCYEYAKGVKRDYKKALEWYTKAAEQGHEPAKDGAERCRANIK
jgi:TPR repeat protein